MTIQKAAETCYFMTKFFNTRKLCLRIYIFSPQCGVRHTNTFSNGDNLHYGATKDFDLRLCSLFRLAYCNSNIDNTYLFVLSRMQFVDDSLLPGTPWGKVILDNDDISFLDWF